MSLGVQIGPESVPGCVSRCGPEVSRVAALGSGAAVDGLSGTKIPASGNSEGGFQSSWNQLIETLGLRPVGEPGEGKAVGAVSDLAFAKPAPSGVLSSLIRVSRPKHKGGATIVPPREAPAVRTDVPEGKKAGAAVSRSSAQVHESRKRDGSNPTSAAGVEAGVEGSRKREFKLLRFRRRTSLLPAAPYRWRAAAAPRKHSLPSLAAHARTGSPRRRSTERQWRMAQVRGGRRATGREATQGVLLPMRTAEAY